MTHPILERYAKLLVGYCTSVREGDNVLLNLETPALPLARPLVREVLRAGGIPHLRLSYPELIEDVLEAAPESFYASEPGLALREIEAVQAWIRVGAPSNTRALQGADKRKLARLRQRQQPVQNHRLRHTRWVGTLYPTDAGAQDAGMSLSEYEAFVFGAMFLDRDDPVAEWQRVHAFQAELIERLKEADEVRITADKTDLRLSVKGRTWINSDGHRNMPSGEVFTSPHEASAEGVITFDVPSSVGGVEVKNVRLTFERGKVVAAEAEVGNDFLQAQLESDDGARYLGEIGIGTNFNIQRPTRSILFDEKIGGTVHLALGQSYAESGGKNASVIHWDMICDLRRGGAIYIDGELFQENGRFI
jgi:aminopeptidase